jgi:hypothetical protein
MSRMKSILAVLVMTAIAGFVPQAHAAGPVFKVVIAGSSAMWQSLALAAYKSGNCVTGGTGGCAHYTSSSNFNLNDTRPPLKGGSTVTDANAVWVVWDHVTTDPTCATSCNVWVYIKVDSVVGDRCYFAQPHCNVNVGTFPAPGNAIGQTLWGDNSADSTPPLTVQAKLASSTGPLVNVAATDIRAEDGLFAMCRANSTAGGGADGVAGLGYGVNPSGACPTVNDLTHLVGGDVLSGYPGSAATAHVLDFNISGTDPFSGRAVPVPTTISVGAAPIIFVTERDHELAAVSNATDAQLQDVFSGNNCDASALGGPAGTIEAYLREPLSGTMNTTEANVFRYPDASGKSQETGVFSGGVLHNPLKALPCASGGNRYRGIGTGEEVKSVLGSFTNNGHDGIGYTFFSYGNVSSIANNAAYGYLTLNGVDGIFHKYGTTIDPGQPATPGVLPAAANLPSSCGSAFPCAEGKIWSGNLSFPNLRNGQYRAWSVLRLVSNGAALANARLLAIGAQTFVVNTVPDFVPAVAVAATDPGLKLLRSHYTQEGVAPVNIATTGDRGGDMGGCILASSGIQKTSDTTTKLAQALPGTSCVVVP